MAYDEAFKERVNGYIGVKTKAQQLGLCAGCASDKITCVFSCNFFCLETG